jgi:hypothetical protein
MGLSSNIIGNRANPPEFQTKPECLRKQKGNENVIEAIAVWDAPQPRQQELGG